VRALVGTLPTRCLAMCNVCRRGQGRRNTAHGLS
jgi:hypothetical protein